MKIKILVSVFVMLSIALSCGISAAANVSAKSGLQVDWWWNDADDEGSQMYIPLEIMGQHNDLFISLLTGYADTHMEPNDGGGRSISNLLDTKLNIAYRIIDRLPLDILLGLDVNFPTGKTDLKQEEFIVIMDPYIIPITTFGEGYNFNPTVSVAKELGDFVVGAGLGYLLRGEYDFSETLKKYDPGDIFSASAEARYYFPEKWNVRVFGNYITYSTDTVKDDDFFEEGDSFVLGAGLHYTEEESMDLGFTLKGIFRDTSQFLDNNGNLASLSDNNHGDEFVADITLLTFIDEETTAKASLQFILVNENDFSEDSSFFIGERRKIGLDAGAAQKLGENIVLELNLKGFFMHDEERNFPEPITELDYWGVAGGLFLTVKF